MFAWVLRMVKEQKRGRGSLQSVGILKGALANQAVMFSNKQIFKMILYS